ncbi:cell cycle checkpoint control protein RAD9B [Menidia menidia]|uniref:Cell cycle checkpoint control protein RAD9A n=1 Tax=Menidia menidia TaxID=238744 RepID=A0A8S4B2H3_9TELE|nr:unnamed protein product [Menidia menidia]
MNCVIEGNCVKVFGKAIHALSRIGDDLWLDPMVKGLALRSVNSAQSAYACFLFSPLFFHHYRLESESEMVRETIRCKLLMKSILPLFRGLTSIERNVERCEISVSAPCDRVIFQFYCRHGITKTHNIRFQESEALQAVFASHLCPNVLKAPARLLGDMVLHFPVFQEEITLSMTSLSVSLRNYCEGGKGHMKVMHTEMSLHPEEFDSFQIGMDSDITFCLKELRGLLAFAESHCLPVSVHFGAAGQPVCFSVEDMLLEASVVLATLTDCESRAPSQPAEPPAPSSPRCADEASVHSGVCEGRSGLPGAFPDVTEVVMSSQGSPMASPADLRHLLEHNSPYRLLQEEPADASGTPASSTVCSLLFKALSSEPDDDDDDDARAVLACYSDDEAPDRPMSPSL